MRRPLVGAAVWLAGFALFSVAVKTTVLRRPAGDVRFQQGQELPNFALHDAGGRRFELDDVVKRNRVVLITFWATWCGPCRIELPHLDVLYRDKKERGLEVLAVNEDEDPAAMTKYLAEKPLGFPVLRDRHGKLAHHLGVKGYPTSILVGRNRRVLLVVNGLASFMDVAIEAHLKDGKSG
ncbi:MAG TPA: TlpA disulfide reductase family protein [Candidatus Binatia bacterium]|nr:TlpA disulfide reductase family protein [Candidatus Binatia bacterium]